MGKYKFKRKEQVIVVNAMHTYSTYRRWMCCYAEKYLDFWDEYDKPIEIGQTYPDRVYTVVKRAPHSPFSDVMLYLIQDNTTLQVYIVSDEAIRTATVNKMGIRDKLGRLFD